MTNETVTKLIYEALRLAVIWSQQSAIQKEWEKLDEAHRELLIAIVNEYMNMEYFPTPEEVHNNWVNACLNMGWIHGEKPDLVPFHQLPQDEKNKSAMIMAMIWLVKQLLKEE